MANQVLRFDVTKQKELQVSQTLITGRVGDGGLKAVTLELLGGEQPYNLTGINIVLEVLKPDDHHIVDEDCCTMLDPLNGLARVVFNNEVFTAQGKCKQAFFKLMRGDLVDSTLEFDIDILPNKVEFGINSKDYLSDYEKLKEQLKEAYEQAIENLSNKCDDIDKRIVGQKKIIETYQQAIDAAEKAVESAKNLAIQIINEALVKIISFYSKEEIDAKFATFATKEEFQNSAVHTSGNQSIDGFKDFRQTPTVNSVPVALDQFVSKTVKTTNTTDFTNESSVRFERWGRLVVANFEITNKSANFAGWKNLMAFPKGYTPVSVVGWGGMLTNKSNRNPALAVYVNASGITVMVSTTNLSENQTCSGTVAYFTNDAWPN